MPHDCFYLEGYFSVGESLSLQGEEHRHLHQVMRHRPGDQVALINGRGSCFQAIVRTVARREATLELIAEERTPMAPPRILLQGMVRPAALDLIAEKATELGISNFFLFYGERSLQRELSTTYHQRLERILIAAIKQSGNRYLPSITLCKDLSMALTAINRKFPTATLFFGDPKATLSLPEALQQTAQCNPTAICIGTESGFSPVEISLLLAAGAIGLSLHTNVLRAETAAIVAAAFLSALPCDRLQLTRTP